ncbi:hypothetical protein PInf_023070 [Phytophthora infestans]|nr:hypothetical protein PInf_023070 [Phytophthora infestans]
MTSKRYKAILVEFMSFNDGRAYTTETVFSSEELLSVKPEDVCRWMNFRAFGEAYPGEDAKPVCARSSTLAYAKKAISSFMPRIAVSWDSIRTEGNPTRSQLVNKLIKTVKHFEVRREGVQSAARRPIEYEEFLNLIELVHATQDNKNLNHIKMKMGRDIARELGVVLLWAALIPVGTFDYDLVPAPLKQRIVAAYANAEATWNLIKYSVYLFRLLAKAPNCS